MATPEIGNLILEVSFGDGGETDLDDLIHEYDRADPDPGVAT